LTLQELRERWRKVKDRPLNDRERQDLEGQMFYQFHLVAQRLEREGQVVFNNNLELDQGEQGRGGKRR
jgi:hypothetical protein